MIKKSYLTVLTFIALLSVVEFAYAEKVQFEAIPTGKEIYLRWDLPSQLKDAEILIYRQRQGKSDKRLITKTPIRKSKTADEIRKKLGATLQVLTADDPSGDEEWNSKSKSERENEIFTLIKENDSKMELLSFVVPDLANALGVQFLDNTIDVTASYTYFLMQKKGDQEILLNSKAVVASNVPQIPTPKIVEAKSENSKVSLFWDKLDQKSGIVGYNVYRNDFETGEFKKINKFPLLAFSADLKKGQKPLPVVYTDEAVENDKEYWYRVRAYHAAGFESDWSDKIRAFPTDTTKPLPVTLLKVETTNEGTIIVRWQLSQEKNISSYNIYRSNSQKGDWKKINSYPVPGNINWYEDSIEEIGTVMWYKISALNSKNIESPLSNSAYTKVTRFSKPVSVKILNAISGENFIDIEWEKSLDPHLAFYEIYRSNSKNDEPMPQKRVKAGVQKYRDINVKPGFTYYYFVMVIDSFEKKSVLSDSYAMSPIDSREVFAPSGLVVRSFENSVILNWTPVQNNKNAGFNIYRRKTIAGGVFKKINENTLDKNQVEYTDILPYEKGSFEYYVTTVSIDSKESKPSSKKVASVWESQPVEVSSLMVVPLGNLETTKSAAMSIQWQPIADENIDGYKIFRKEVGSKNTNFVPLQFVKYPNSAFIDKNIKPKIRYGYQVVAVDKRGNEGPVCPPEYNSFGDPIQ